jgi:hypothetical protein
MLVMGKVELPKSTLPICPLNAGLFICKQIVNGSDELCQMTTKCCLPRAASSGLTVHAPQLGPSRPTGPQTPWRLRSDGNALSTGSA